MKSKEVMVSVVIPHWNKKELLDECLESLYKQTFTNFEIIVVDNGSTDGSAAFIEKNHPEVSLVALPKNTGFSGGVNTGIKLSKAKYVALLNNDAIAEPVWLEKLVKVIDGDKNIGSVASKILTNKKKGDNYTLDSTGEFLSIWGSSFPRGRDEVDTGQYDTEGEEVFAASGGASIYRAEMLKNIGLFDEDFFAYFEDVDVGFRAQLLGYKNLYCPGAKVYHHIGASTGGSASPFTRFHYSKNIILLFIKDMPLGLLIKYGPLLLMSVILGTLGSIRRRLLRAQLKGICMAILLIPKFLVKRWRIQKVSTVSSKEIDDILYHSMPAIQKKNLPKLPVIR